MTQKNKKLNISITSFFPLQLTVRLLQTDPGVLPDIPCASLNVKEQFGAEQHPLTVHHLSTFRCYMRALSERIPELSEHLNTSSQYLQDVEQQQGNRTVPVTCKLPTFEQNLYDYVYAKCLLQLVDERLSNSKI